MGLSNVRKTLSSLLSTDLVKVVRDKEDDKLISVAELAKAVATGLTNASSMTVDTLSATAVILPIQVLTGDGAITLKHGLAILNKAGAIAATLADPTATTDDGKVLTVLSITAQAHTVDIAGGLNGAGASANLGTFGAAIGNSFQVVAYQGKWYCYSTHVGVTWN